jgi:hypothetical protein
MAMPSRKSKIVFTTIPAAKEATLVATADQLISGMNVIVVES